MPLPDTEPPVLTVLLVSYNTRHLLDECLGALETACQRVGGAQVIVVDNASRDGSAEYLAARHPEVLLLRSATNVGFGRANNLALPHVRGRYVLLLNTDAFVSPQTVAQTLAYMDTRPRCGILGVRLAGRDGQPQPSCRAFPTPLNLFLQRTGLSRWMPSVPLVDGAGLVPAGPQACDWVPGCYYLVRREVIDQVGLFDPRFFLYYEEVDHCFAARRAGWEVCCYPHTTVVHIGGESARMDGAITPAGRQVERIEIASALLYFRKNLGLAAVLGHLALDTLADLLLAGARLLRRQPAAAGYHLRRLAVGWGLAGATRLGARPTR